MAGRNSDFHPLWASQATARMGIEITRLAFPFVAAIGLDGSPMQVTAVAAVQYLPALLFGLPAGAWVDRMDRRVLLAVAGFGRFAALTVVALLFWLGMLTFPALYAGAFVVGICTLVHELSYQSVLPQLIGAEDLVTGNGRLEATRSVAAAVGPLVGGALIQAVSAAGALVSDAAFHALSGWSALRLRRSAMTRRVDPGRFRDELAEGLRTVLRDRVQFRLTAVTVSAYLVALAVQALYVLYGARVVHLSPLVIGVTFAAGAAGAVAVAVPMRRLSAWTSPRTAIVVGLSISAAGYLVIPLAPDGSTVAAAVVLSIASVLGQAGVVLVAAQAMAWRQRITPAHLLGRVISVSRSLAGAAIPISAILAGVLAELIGIRATLVLAGLGMIATSAWIVTPAAGATIAKEQAPRRAGEFLGR